MVFIKTAELLSSIYVHIFMCKQEIAPSWEIACHIIYKRTFENESCIVNHNISSENNVNLPQDVVISSYITSGIGLSHSWPTQR
jgi:hypothetical protein